MNNQLAHRIANLIPSKSFRYAWTSSESKNPRHLSFDGGARIAYMRDGILTLTDGRAGTYLRHREFVDGQHHEVTLTIDARVWDGATELKEENVQP